MYRAFKRACPRIPVAAAVLGLTVVLSGLPKKDRIQFAEVAAAAGIDFKHENGSSAEKELPETMSGGAVVFDYDGDGWPDLFFVNGGSFVDRRKSSEARHHLYRNNRDGSFVDMTQESGIAVSGFGMGACAADYNNDGHEDLVVTGVGFVHLYRNAGQRFVDAGDSSGIRSPSWNASCAFGDIDNDGDVDLYLTRYVDFTPLKNKYCSFPGIARAYCHPNEYKSLPDALFRNEGDGTFVDITRESGIYREDGNGLGVVFGDYDGDGFVDIYVANDSTPNFLFHNRGGSFEEVGLLSGVAVGNTGVPLAGMGTDMGDIDGDGLPDLFVTNLNLQAHNLYRNLGDGLFADLTFTSGVAEATLPFVGFGAAFMDYDNDGDLDLAVANGHVIDNVSLGRDDTTYEQPNLLLQNDGSGRFRNVTADSGEGFAVRKASRALAVGDLDNDGDMDIVVVNSGDRADILRNEGGNGMNSLIVRTEGVLSNRDGIGARLRLSVNGKTLVREVKAGSSYLARNDLRVHFGLGRASTADRLEVQWPSGAVDVLEKIGGNQILTLREGKGLVGKAAMPGSH